MEFKTIEFFDQIIFTEKNFAQLFIDRIIFDLWLERRYNLFLANLAALNSDWRADITSQAFVDILYGGTGHALNI